MRDERVMAMLLLPAQITAWLWRATRISQAPFSAVAGSARATRVSDQAADSSSASFLASSASSTAYSASSIAE
jgi:hypothetical protein